MLGLASNQIVHKVAFLLVVSLNLFSLRSYANQITSINAVIDKTIAFDAMINQLEFPASNLNLPEEIIEACAVTFGEMANTAAGISLHTVKITGPECPILMDAKYFRNFSAKKTIDQEYESSVKIESDNLIKKFGFKTFKQTSRAFNSTTIRSIQISREYLLDSGKTLKLSVILTDNYTNAWHLMSVEGNLATENQLIEYSSKLESKGHCQLNGIPLNQDECNKSDLDRRFKTLLQYYLAY